MTQWRYTDTTNTTAQRIFSDGSSESRLAIAIDQTADGAILPFVSTISDASLIMQNVTELWQSAHEYESQYVTGVAIGLLTIGSLKGSPKAMAIQGWVKSLWTLYYQRKANVGVVLDPALLDFSSVGSPPFSMLQLQIELGL